jgi:hypothetical protein
VVYPLMPRSTMSERVSLHPDEQGRGSMTWLAMMTKAASRRLRCDQTAARLCTAAKPQSICRNAEKLRLFLQKYISDLLCGLARRLAVE